MVVARIGVHVYLHRTYPCQVHNLNNRNFTDAISNNLVVTNHRVQGGHPHFVLPRFDENISFGIKHYAGELLGQLRTCCDA